LHIDKKEETVSKPEERENDADGRLPAGVSTGSSPDRKKRRSAVPPVLVDPEVAHDPIQASYETLDALLQFLIARAKGDDGYDLIALREALHGGSL
jgi:hypothetical protein